MKYKFFCIIIILYVAYELMGSIINSSVIHHDNRSIVWASHNFYILNNY